MFYVMSAEKDGAKVIDTADGVVEFLSKSQLLDALKQGIAIEGLRYSKGTKAGISVKAVPLSVINIMELELGIPFMFKIGTSEWTQAIYGGASYNSGYAKLSFIVKDNNAKFRVSVLHFTVEQLTFKEVQMRIKFNDNEPCDVAFINKMVRQAGGFNNL